MRINIFILLSLLISSYAQANHGLLANIGFYNEDMYIGVNPDFTANGIVYTFNLCHTSLNKCHPISSCTYSESRLKEELDQVENSQVRDDFDWIFFSSGYSSEELIPFIEEFKKLLIRANSKCQDIDLGPLNNQRFS